MLEMSAMLNPSCEVNYLLASPTATQRGPVPYIFPPRQLDQGSAWDPIYTHP